MEEDIQKAIEIIRNSHWTDGTVLKDTADLTAIERVGELKAIEATRALVDFILEKRDDLEINWAEMKELAVPGQQLNLENYQNVQINIQNLVIRINTAFDALEKIGIPEAIRFVLKEHAALAAKEKDVYNAVPYEHDIWLPAYEALLRFEAQLSVFLPMLGSSAAPEIADETRKNWTNLRWLIVLIVMLEKIGNGAVVPVLEQLAEKHDDALMRKKARDAAEKIKRNVTGQASGGLQPSDDTKRKEDFVRQVAPKPQQNGQPPAKAPLQQSKSKIGGE